MPFLLLISLLILLQHFLIMLTALILLSLNFNKHAPPKSKVIRTKPCNPWFTQAIEKLKLTKCNLERLWSHTHGSKDLKNMRSATNHYHAATIKAK